MDTFNLLRAAMFEHAREHLESDMRAKAPCAEYQAMMRATLDTIRAAKCFDDLARLEWIQGQAAMGEDVARYDSDVPNL
jgi:hypothetical protein